LAEDVRAGQARVRFEATWLGPLELPRGAEPLALAIGALDGAGLCPVLGDGLAAGNAAMVVEGRLFLTPSGRRPGPLQPDRLVELVDFDPLTWSARYRSREPESRPTSDAPLYHAILREAAASWPTPPTVALHGHALETPAHAARLGAPIADEETEFSTPEDRQALLALVRRAPWPEQDLWIRRGHGFFLVGRDLDATLARALTLAA
jgi:ribulose-5-phosphate 4-epimerase/fuculose-1-phosphate aldolase